MTSQQQGYQRFRTSGMTMLLSLLQNCCFNLSGIDEKDGFTRHIRIRLDFKLPTCAGFVPLSWGRSGPPIAKNCELWETTMTPSWRTEMSKKSLPLRRPKTAEALAASPTWHHVWANIIGFCTGSTWVNIIPFVWSHLGLSIPTKEENPARWSSTCTRLNMFDAGFWNTKTVDRARFLWPEQITKAT